MAFFIEYVWTGCSKIFQYDRNSLENHLIERFFRGHPVQLASYQPFYYFILNFLHLLLCCSFRLSILFFKNTHFKKESINIERISWKIKVWNALFVANSIWSCLEINVKLEIIGKNGLGEHKRPSILKLAMEIFYFIRLEYALCF